MGCISSKRAVSASPAVDDLEGIIRLKRSTTNNNQRQGGPCPSSTTTNGNNQNQTYAETQLLPVRRLSSEEGDSVGFDDDLVNEKSGKKLKGAKSKTSNSTFSLNLRFGSSNKSQVVAEQTAAGWPTWLTAVAGEAIHGWVPLRADGFQKLDKVM